jgi:hypothetical protein
MNKSSEGSFSLDHVDEVSDEVSPVLLGLVYEGVGCCWMVEVSKGPIPKLSGFRWFYERSLMKHVGHS